MTISEFSSEFDTLVDSYKRFKDFDKQEQLDSLDFSEYEKSVFLTEAQLETVISLYNGKNLRGDSFETTEEFRRYLDGLVETKLYTDEDFDNHKIGVSENSLFVTLPTDIAFITLEQVVYGDNLLGCYNGSRVAVYPVTQDEYARVKDNPFRGPTKYKVIRLDYGNNIVELISKYTIAKYIIKYLRKPKPIILEDLPSGVSIEGETEAHECELNDILHRAILERAVAQAVTSKSYGVKTNRDS